MKTSTLAGLVVASLAALASSASCTSFSGEGEPQADAGAGDATPASDAGASDAVASDSGGCPVLFDESFEDGQLWKLEPSNLVTSGSLQLTQASKGQQGVATWNKEVGPGQYDVDVDIDISAPGGSGSPGEGMTLWWSESTAAPAPGTAQSFGACNSGRRGVAVVMSTREGTLRLVSLDPGTCGDIERSMPNAFRPGRYSLKVKVNGPDVSATLTTSTGPESWVVNGKMPPFTIRFMGFSATTGDSFARHAVDRAKATYCPSSK
ncbi:MAG: hypothetical protein JST00_06385 [Deltaproteobacteria bacterium]|nr:hypothetical protein [Deltaproteobacteria bacterium]